MHKQSDVPITDQMHHMGQLHYQLFSNPIHLINTILIKESDKLLSGYVMHNNFTNYFLKISFPVLLYSLLP